ncbi:MAG TPA: hypothetical protein VFJ82_12045 [Longimicrobium sp.]|nr:hypothetical protein [Longimicrobium sp.]
MDTLAPPTLVFRRRSTLERLVLDPALEIGAGGEAVVYEVPGDQRLVAKIYHQPGIERARKLTLMLANPPRLPEGTSIAWPVDLLLHPGGFAGFLMPRADGPRLFEFYNPVTRRATAPAFHYGLLHRAGRNLAEAFHALHQAGYVVGDVNESNLLVHPRTAAATLVDADSFQVRDEEAGAVFRSRVGKAEFTPPELQGVSFNDVDRAPEHDRFGLAVLLFLLLMEGTHPFAVRMSPGEDALPVEERIRLGLFPHAREDDEVHPPRLSPRFDTLDPGLRALFVRCFVQGHADPAARPAPAEWAQALETAEAALAACERNPLHRHHPHLQACPWCERAQLLGGRDPFPAGAVHAPMHIPPRPRRPRLATPFDAAPAPVDPTMAAMRFGVQPPFHGVSLSAGGLQPAPVRPAGPPAPQVFGPSGLGNPLVFAFAGLSMALAGGGGLAAVGLFVAAVAVGVLLMGEWRQVRAATLVLSVCVALFVGSVVGLGFGASDGGDTSYEYSDDYAPPSPPPPADGPLNPALQMAEEEETVPSASRAMLDLMLADLHSTPLSEGASDPGPAQAPGDAGELYDGAAVDKLPSLLNPSEAGRVLAWFYPEKRPGHLRADTAMLWLHVGADGRVTPNGQQLIRATSSNASSAATATVPYLRYRPATVRDGHAVGVWITQRMVIDP